MASSSKPNTTHVDEDVDDLDDVLEQFSSPLPKPAAPAESSRQPAPSSSSQEPPNPSAEYPFTDDFANEFAKGMEALMRELGDGTVDLDDLSKLAAEEKESEQERIFKDAWNKIMGDSGPSASTSTPTPPANAKGSRDGPEESFQDRIRQAMDKMKEGQSSLKSSDGGGNPDLEALLSSLNVGAEGEDENELQGLLETMMSQLMSKEVLYEPLKEMHEKFPSYLTENENKFSQEDKNRYKKQQEIVSQIITIFEAKDYSEEDPQTNLKVMALMNEMQEYGAPPTEIMGELPPGVPVGPDGLPQLPKDCCIT